MKNESILDHPVEDLDQLVWRRDESGNYVLTDEAREKISALVSWACGVLGVSNAEANITGSITSNTFTPESDIDVHIHSPEISEDNADEANKTLRKQFEEQYKTNNGNSCFIGEHPLEVYFQSNPFQDLMSVGCYSLGRGWLVGPELKSMDYDPYKEYYEDDKKHIESIIGDVRNKILQIYEDAIAYVNSSDDLFKTIDFVGIAADLHNASLLFKQAREFRKVYSSPRSEQEALRRRESKEWKIADSAFKLLDKFGYLGILRTFSQVLEDKTQTEEDVVRTIIDSIRDNIGNNRNLTEDEKSMFGSLDESIASTIGKLALIGSMLAVPEVTDAKTIAKGLEKVPKQERRITSPKVSDVVKASSKIKTKLSGLSYCHLQNLMATIIYNEAMIDYVKFKDERCLVAIANVIENRAGGDANRFASVVTKKDQFYSKKHVRGGVTDKDYITYYPYGGSKKIWTKCNDIAKKMLDGTLENVIGERNMIANEKKDAEDAWEDWGKRCDLKIGSHTFGYEADQDGYKKYGTKKKAELKKDKLTYKIHVVRKGDNMTKIAKAYGSTVEDILKMNTWLKNADKIMIGQKLRVGK